MQHRFFLFIFTAASSAWVPKQHRWYMDIKFKFIIYHIWIIECHLNIDATLDQGHPRPTGWPGEEHTKEFPSPSPFPPLPQTSLAVSQFYTIVCLSNEIWAKQLANLYAIFPSFTFGDLPSLTSRFPLTALSLLVYRQSKPRVWGFKGQGPLPVLKVWLLVIYFDLTEVIPALLEGLSYLAAMPNSKLGHNRTPVEGQQGPPWPEKIFHPRFGSSRNENDEDKVIKKGTRSSSARPSLWRWTIFITLSFLFNLTFYHFLRFFNQVQTSKEVWCHFQEVWRLDVQSFHLYF